MSCKIILRPSFASLLGHLKSAVQRKSEEVLISPKWIIAPNKTAAAFLRSSLAETLAETPLFGVRVLPLPNFTRNLLLSLGRIRGQRWSPLLDFLLQELVSRSPDTSPLAPLKDISMGHHLIRPTLMDLADAGLGDSLESLDELSNDPILDPTEAALFKLFLNWITLLQAAELRWEPLEVQKLNADLENCPQEQLHRSLGAETDQMPEIFVYGFYDFTDLNIQLLVELSRRLRLHLYLPAISDGNRESAHTFSLEVLENFQLRMGEGNYELDSATDINDPEKYFLDTFPDGIISDKPSFLSYQRASGVRAEALSAAVRVESWLQEGRFDANDILVLAPQLKPYYENVLEVFASFKIPLKVADLPVESSAGTHPLHIIQVLCQEQAPLEWLLYYLREFPTVLDHNGIELEHFERSLRELPFSGGPGWKQLAEELDEDGKVGTLSHPRFTPEEVRFIKEIEQLWNQPPAMSPAEALSFLNRLRSWLEEPGLVDSLIEGLEQLTELRPNLAIPSEALSAGLTEASSYSDDLDGTGVLFSSFMRARGITARAIILIGLSADQFPPRVEEDPFLSDRTRLRLARSARDIGHRLSAKRLLSDEMALLFFLINTSAEKIHWVIPETDEAGKSVSPTPMVLRYLQRWESQSSQPSSGNLPRAPVEQARYLQSLDPAKGSLLPPNFASLLDPELTGSENSELRQESEAPAWAGHIPTVWKSSERKRLSVTRLQNLARCPFRFWAGSARDLEAIELKTRVTEMDPRTWGSLIHSSLEVLFQPSVGHDESVASISSRLLAGNPLQAISGKLPPKVVTQLNLAPPVFRSAHIRKLIRTITDYLESEVKQEESGTILAQELLVSRPFPGLEDAELIGKVDRVDRLDSRIRVVDYKTGKRPWPTKAIRNHELRLGYSLQPSLYPWLYAESDDEKPAFAYIFLGETPARHEAVEERVNLSRFFDSTKEILLNGAFLAISNEIFASLGIDSIRPCQYCEFGSLCRRPDPRHIRRNIPLIKKLANRRFQEFLQVTGQGKADE